MQNIDFDYLIGIEYVRTYPNLKKLCIFPPDLKTKLYPNEKSPFNRYCVMCHIHVH